MSSTADLLNCIQACKDGLTLTELLKQRPERARRYFSAITPSCIPEADQAGVQALMIEELRRLQEGVLARYRVRLSEYAAWKKVHGY